MTSISRKIHIGIVLTIGIFNTIIFRFGELKKFAVKYSINPKVVYPHSFRHRFAKSFLERCNDIAFLADLMGHESIETTRIYLRKTATERREIVDSIIDW